MSTSKKFARVLHNASVVIVILGLVGGGILANVEVQGMYRSHTEFSLSIFLTFFISSILVSLIFRGFSEIIY